MRIRTGKTKNGRLFYVIKTYYDTKGIEHTVTVEKLGNENDIRERTGRDPDEWAKEYVKILNEKEKEENTEVVVKHARNKIVPKDSPNSYNCGYLFLQYLYHNLGLDEFSRKVQKEYDIEYDFNCIFSRLIYGRILHPSSKLETAKWAATLLEQPDFSTHHVYRALDIIQQRSDELQKALYQNSISFGGKRNTGVLYYDCTNFFYEIEEQDVDGLRKYGKSKQHQPLPIVEMGLFTDYDGIPLAMAIHPGNTNEQITLKPIEKKVITDFGLSKFIVCTDAGLCSKANKRFNTIQDRSYIVTQPIKKLKAELKDWALAPEGWLRAGERKTRKRYNLEDLDANECYDAIFYKECPVDQNSFEERLIVTFSFKYQAYQRAIREGQIERATKAIEQGGDKLKRRNLNDYRRFIISTSSTADGEVADKHTYTLSKEKISEEAKYDGFYATTSDLDNNDPMDIIKVNRMRWQIEECFRIMKTEFQARPAYVQKDNRIEAHFLTCFTALYLYRYLEKMTKSRYTCEQIIDTLRNMRLHEIIGKGYSCDYTRTDITDELHDAFGFRTDYEFMDRGDLKNILHASKKVIRHAKSK